MLYLITNRKISNKDYLDVIRDSVMVGVDVIILREKDLNDKELLNIALSIKEIIKDTDTKLIINGNIEVAKKVSAEGIHLSYKDFVKKKTNYNGLVGVSVHKVEESIMACEKEADYLLASHIYETNCKKGLKPKGLSFLKEIKNKVNIPVIGLGGISHLNAKEVIDAGADGIAVMSYIMSSDDPYNATLKLKEQLIK